MKPIKKVYRLRTITRLICGLDVLETNHKAQKNNLYLNKRKILIFTNIFVQNKKVMEIDIIIQLA